MATSDTLRETIVGIPYVRGSRFEELLLLTKTADIESQTLADRLFEERLIYYLVNWNTLVEQQKKIIVFEVHKDDSSKDEEHHRKMIDTAIFSIRRYISELLQIPATDLTESDIRSVISRIIKGEIIEIVETELVES